LKAVGSTAKFVIGNGNSTHVVYDVGKNSQKHLPAKTVLVEVSHLGWGMGPLGIIRK
jgi:hypothetical protein